MTDKNQQKITSSIHRQDAKEKPLNHWSSIAEKMQLNSVISLDDLEKKSTSEIEKVVKSMQQKWHQLVSLVNEQEVELSEQEEFIRELEKTLYTATQRDRARLEQELAYEQEKQRMLNATLIGQRYNLQKNQEILFYYQDILSRRQAKESKLNKMQN